MDRRWPAYILSVAFQSYMAIAVFQGQQKCRGSRITVERIVETPQELVVLVTEWTMQSTCLVLCPGGNPWEVVMTPRRHKPLRFVSTVKDSCLLPR